MNPYYSKFLNLLRLLAGSFILVGALLLAAYVLKTRRDRAPLEAGRLVAKAIPLVAGVVILIKSPAWARRLTQDFDE